MSGWLVAVTVGAAVGSGVVGGVFFGFSTFVMRALDRLAPAESIRAMQAINEEAPTPWFMAALVGTLVLCAAVAAGAVARWGEPGAAYQLVGCVVYLAGFALTPGYHVPRNDALARVDASSGDSAREWRAYSTGWTAWNHVRAAAPIAAAALFSVALWVA
jgi:uncharacterized membrane protein